eukprot:m.124618 g.124618  ORF g.124618 m.124618 type:complete len:312 (+) comp16298_c1_seq3:387-1322(+)
MSAASRVLSRVGLTRSYATKAPAISKVAVFGSGLMGSGIAQVAAATSHKVTLLDVSMPVLEKAKANMQKSLVRVAKKQHADNDKLAQEYVDRTMANISISTKTSDIANVDLVIEAVPENIELKHKLFKELDAVCGQSTIFASNTSSLSITKIAAATKRGDRFGGLHFFNPVPVMKLVEVVRIASTSDATVEALRNFGTAVGKHVVMCKDTPGFIVNRLLVPYLLEAARMAERGDASIEDIDAAMKLGAGHPMGPIQLLDYVGLDTTAFIARGWAKDFPEEPLFKPVPAIEKLVGEGNMGAKSGKGYYNYKK